MNKIFLGLCLALNSTAFAQTHPIPVSVMLNPIAKKKYKNLTFTGQMYETQGKLKHPIAFMIDHQINTELDIKKFSAGTQRRYFEFLTEVALRKENFKESHLKRLLKDMGQDTAQFSIEALIQIVMLEVTKSTNEDLRTLLEEIKSNKKKKEEHRQSIARAKAEKSRCLRVKCEYFSVQDLDTIIMVWAQQLETIDDLEEMLNLRLQTAMDRMTIFSETLSNIMKRMLATSMDVLQS